jgi:hypothetical protein
VTTEEVLIDQYVTETQVMLARLGDHLISFDSFREEHKFSSLDQFGLRTEQTETYCENLQQLVSAHLDRFDVHMADYLRYAHVLLTYMVFENRLDAFGRLISETGKGPPFSANTGNGTLLQKFNAYLVSLSLSPPRSDTVDSLRLIRNCITHNRGRLKGASYEKSLRARLSKLVGVSADSGSITLTTEGCLRLQEAVIQYLHGIDSAGGFHIWIPPAIRQEQKTFGS